jgi:hypothetical protein
MSLIVNYTELSLGWAVPLSNEFHQISKNIDNLISLAYLSMEQATILVLLHHHHHHHHHQWLYSICKDLGRLTPEVS